MKPCTVIEFRLVRGNPQLPAIKGTFYAKITQCSKRDHTCQMVVFKGPKALHYTEIAQEPLAFDKRWYVGDADYYLNIMNQY